MKSNGYITLVILPFLLLLGCEDKKTPTEVDTESVTWTKVESGVTNWLRDVDFSDEQNGWVVGDSGTILHSSNGGESWQRQTCPIEDYLFAVDFVDNKNGWICSMNYILRTTNGGKSWEIKYSEDLGEGRFRDIQFFDKNIGFIVGGKGSFGSRGVLLKTDNGGETWQRASLNRLPTLTHISIVNEQNIWICGFGGTILFTNDAGSKWTKKTLDISSLPFLTTIQFVDQNNGWVGSRDDYLGFYTTVDGGNTWERISEYSFANVCGVLSFFFVDENNGWLCNFPFDRILKTVDGGSTWEYDSEIRQRLKSIIFIDNKTGWAVGKNGCILKYSKNNNTH